MIADDILVQQVIENNNCFVGRNGYKVKWVILHSTAGGSSAENIGYYFQGTENTGNPVSAHYIIDQAGIIVQCNKESDGAWANGYLSQGHDSWWDENINPNNLTISIEHVKTTQDNSAYLTREQQISSFKLIQRICARNNIPARAADENGGITGHYSIDPINRSRCPGTFPWSDLWQFLSENGDAMLSISQAAGFFKEVEPNQRWHCISTNVDIAYAILQYYRTCTQVGLNGLSQYGLPLSGEEQVKDANGNPLKGVVLQRFERGVICYDPARENDSAPGITGACYPMHIDQGQGQDARILAALQKKAEQTPATDQTTQDQTQTKPTRKSSTKS